MIQIACEAYASWESLERDDKSLVNTGVKGNQQNGGNGDVPIAIFTSSQAGSDKARSDSLGAARYIQKPSGLDEFLSTVGRAIKEMLAV